MHSQLPGVLYVLHKHKHKPINVRGRYTKVSFIDENTGNDFILNSADSPDFILNSVDTCALPLSSRTGPK